MPKIQVLGETVANRIAAGEIVERPSSVVKELIENAIDAGPRKIMVDVEGGGKSLLRVTDDGEGMSRDDATLCLERHATSKLCGPDDLLAIKTLGFRGEALPSIASVSRLTLETQEDGSPAGTLVEVIGGTVVSVREGAFPRGTRIEVRDLFFNVPARRKFLRSESYELSQITSYSVHYALAFPEIHFRVRSSNLEILSAPPASGFRDRIYQVFGKDLVNDLVEGRKEFPRAGVRLHLFTSRPHVQKYNRSSMYFFINRRLVRDKIMVHAISEAYRSILPSRTFPVTIVYVDVRFEDVDVNVHPAKTEVRFRQPSFVHDAIRDSVVEALRSTKTIVAVDGDVRPIHHSGPVPAPQVPESWSGGPIAEGAFRVDPEARASYAEERSLTLGLGARSAAGVDSAVGTAYPSFEQVRSEIRPLGQLRDSFIVAVDATGLLLIDQHVAHERVLFETYLEQRRGGRLEVQRLLMPIVVGLTPRQLVILETIVLEMARNGFDVEPFGARTIAVKTAPAILKAEAVERLLVELLDGLERETQAMNIEAFEKKIAATVSCHAAIKINNPLDEIKMRWLVSELMKTDCPTVCPHGRPIVLRYDLKDIQKAFRRS